MPNCVGVLITNYSLPETSKHERQWETTGTILNPTVFPNLPTHPQHTYTQSSTMAQSIIKMLEAESVREGVSVGVSRVSQRPNETSRVSQASGGFTSSCMLSAATYFSPTLFLPRCLQGKKYDNAMHDS